MQGKGTHLIKKYYLGPEECPRITAKCKVRGHTSTGSIVKGLRNVPELQQKCKVRGHTSSRSILYGLRDVLESMAENKRE